MTGAIIALMDALRLILRATTIWFKRYETAHIKRQLEREMRSRNQNSTETARTARRDRRALDADAGVLREDDGFRRD